MTENTPTDQMTEPTSRGEWPGAPPLCVAPQADRLVANPFNPSNTIESRLENPIVTAKFSEGQPVAVKVYAQRGSHGARTPVRKVMEIATVYTDPATGKSCYTLRRPGSTTKGGQRPYSDYELEAL